MPNKSQSNWRFEVKLCALYTHHQPLGHHHTVVSPHLPCVKTCMLVTCWKRCAGAADSPTPYHNTTLNPLLLYKMGEAQTKKEKIRIVSWQKKKNKNGWEELEGEAADEHTGICLCGLSISSPRTLGSQLPMLIDIPIKEISRFREEERAREQRNYCRCCSSLRERRGEDRGEMTGWKSKEDLN